MGVECAGQFFRAREMDKDATVGADAEDAEWGLENAEGSSLSFGQAARGRAVAGTGRINVRARCGESKAR